MGSCCSPVQVQSKKFRKVVWIAFALNLTMFFYEFGASFLADSQALKADSLDFLGDAANYAVSLFVLNRALQLRAKASMIKALTMGSFGFFVVFEVIQSIINNSTPNSEVMSVLGVIALAVNVFVAVILYQFREGDSNMQSVWLCSRNDAIGNIAVLLAATLVYYLKTPWPDLIVAILMAYLSLTASFKVFKLAKVELQTVRTNPLCPNIKEAHSFIVNSKTLYKSLIGFYKRL